MKSRLTRVTRGLAVVALAVTILGLGWSSPATGQVPDDVVAAVEVNQASAFAGAVECGPSEVVNAPQHYWGVLVHDGGSEQATLATQCGDRYGVLVMQVDDTDPRAVDPPGSLRVHLAAFLYEGSALCDYQLVTVDVPDARFDRFQRMLGVSGCDTWWWLEAEVWYGGVPQSVFCERPGVNWC